MNLLGDFLKSILFTIYILFVIAATVGTYYVIAGQGAANWLAWAGAIAVLAILSAIYVFRPSRGSKDQ